SRNLQMNKDPNMRPLSLIALLLAFGCSDPTPPEPAPAPVQTGAAPTVTEPPTQPPVPEAGPAEPEPKTNAPSKAELAERLRKAAKSRGKQVKAQAPKVGSESIDLSCSVASDCAVKNVGNCCGYFPRCVNVDFKPDPDRVKKECEREGRMGICGFVEIESCECVDQQCVAADSGR
ncbi:MAG: hypothetical protein AAFQ82_07465, partial [Myxococcota bacterium]